MSEAALACALLALDPTGLKGAVLKGDAAAFLSALKQLSGRTCHRVPPHIGIDRLAGAIDVAATLKSGAPVHDHGLLAEARGLLLLTSAERLPLDRAALIAAAMDHGAPFTVIAHDEGIDDEHAPMILIERVAFLLDVSTYEPLDIDIGAARALLPSVVIPDRITEGLCQTALALGLSSIRPAVMALRAARAAAALDGRLAVDDDDAGLAARLVLAPRAVTYPAVEDEPEQPAPQDQPDPGDTEDGAPTPQDLADRLLDAVKASLPEGLLAALERNLRQPASRSGAGAVSQKAGLRRGRPAGTRQGEPKNGARLSLIDTLRAAAPWQPLRRRSNPVRKGLQVEKPDFRIRRFKEKRETTAIFAVDASGSAALHRMAEAKGAVELLLADCYVRRDRTALIAFRGKQAELLLPPTRSLQRAKKSLADLPGGGGTPLAAGIEQSMLVADQVRRAGGVPLIVFLTDGKANIARDGTADRAAALRDAEAAARALRIAGVRTLMIDLSDTRTGPARRLAEAMGADYLPLPHADATKISARVNAAMQA
ncbi:magnesium chelatase ATPase subunit D [Aestuariivirga litoralis]|uniref:Magnesium chelatase ATPase subunit D n=1 Tax=Aestuariivirga litoralis TaxID=2650924 RepID=A0A2W2B6U3_9HYPH|nr:magnesium chelatase subunit D [Aestuariivirga litoralis]PZF76044.1 magnesium chelatase ATPase subunit D [Aestuariivirga litoralis]